MYYPASNKIKLKIWVVEDDPTYRNMLISYLFVLGYRAEQFSSGEECMAYLSDKPDVVILDHHLGKGIQGVEVLRQIKEVKKDTSVICVSAEESASIIADTYRLGTDDYIGKDSASLLRLKLRLEKLERIHNLRRRKRTRKMIFRSLFFASLCSLVIVWTYWLLTKY